PLVDLGPDTTICLDGMPVYLQNLKPAPSADHHYIWNTGDTSDILKIVQPGVYSLKVVTEPVQCTTLDEVEIKKDCYVDIPNAFTPNGDGENDYFFPRSLLTKSVTNFRMEVFNRWGQMVFQTERIDGRGWDGRFNNIDQGQGVYIYRIEVAYTNDRSEHYEGNVTLLR